MKVCRAALSLLKRRGGAIVNVASVGAFNGSSANAAYSASEAALVSFTRTLAYAHGADGIRANAVAPGWVGTPMSELERTFGWMTRWRRFVRDYEPRIEVSHAMILVAMGGNLLRRTAHP